jgi:hypothetical protein
VHHLQAALFKAEDEVAQLRDQVSQLQTQANQLFESNFSQGMLSYDISIRCSWMDLAYSESRDVSDIRGYPANTPRSAEAALNNVQEVSSSFGGFCFPDQIDHELGVCNGVIGRFSADQGGCGTRHPICGPDR